MNAISSRTMHGHRTRLWIVLPLLALWATPAKAPPSVPIQPFSDGRAIDLDRVIPSNERGILCLAEGKDRLIYGGTTGRAAHLFVHDPASGKSRSLARLPGGIGLSHGLVVLPDGTLIAGTQTDPTGTARETDPKAVGRLLKFSELHQNPARVEELCVPVPGQGVYTLAYDAASQILVGNTWPDGHFFSFDLKTGQCQDHGIIAGQHPFETKRYEDLLNKEGPKPIRYARQVSRAIVVVPGFGALTAGANGVLFKFDFASRKLEKMNLQLPSVPGRESWASLDAGLVLPRIHDGEEYPCMVGGTAEGYMIELRFYTKENWELRARGRPLAPGNIHGMVSHQGPMPGGGKGKKDFTVVGVGGSPYGIPRGFTWKQGSGTATLLPGHVPQVDGLPSFVGFGALLAASDGSIYAGEKDRIARLVRYHAPELAPPRVKTQKNTPTLLGDPGPVSKISPPRLPCQVVFAPPGTTTEGSGYTAIAVAFDGKVYVGTARYGGYAWLVRFDPAQKTLFMEKVADVQKLTGERLGGLNTQGKIHAIIIIGPDGRVWFATKQAHEIFGTRPEYGEASESYPGGHLLSYDPKTGFARSMGILKKHEGLMAGAMDKKRHKIYYRTEPKNFFISFDVTSGAVEERGHLGGAGRYMVIDAQDAVYTMGRGMYLSRFDPETGYVEDLTIKLEGSGHFEAPYVLALGPGGKLYGAGTRHPWILEFDIDTYKKGPFPEVVVRNIAPAAPTGMPVHDIHAGVFGKDGKFYYPLLTGPANAKGRQDRFLQIMRFDPVKKISETVGIPDTSSVDESKVKHAYMRGDKYALDHIQGAAVGEDGTLFLMDIYPQLNVAVFPKLTAPK